jgi:hypothetical protein
MSDVLANFVRGRVLAACVVAGGLATFTASSAQAQLFNFLFGDGLRASQIERMLEIRGMQPLGPISRNGRVYIADVAVAAGRSQRLVIDAYDGRILERFRLGPRYYADIASPRPPVDIGTDAVERPPPNSSSNGGWPVVIPFIGESTERGDEAASPNIAAVPRGDDVDAKGKAKASVKHKKIDLTPTSQPSSTPSTPADAKPATSEASSGTPPAPDVKVASPPAAPAPSLAPASKAAGGKPAINDVPVDPLD